MTQGIKNIFFCIESLQDLVLPQSMYTYTFYMPRTSVDGSPLSFRKESKIILKGVVLSTRGAYKERPGAAWRSKFESIFSSALVAYLNILI